MISLENVGIPEAAATQAVAYSAAAAATTALTEGRIFRIQTTTDAFIRIAADAVAVAATDMPILAGTPEYFRVPKGYRISAIRNNTDGVMSATPME